MTPLLVARGWPGRPHTAGTVRTARGAAAAALRAAAAAAASRRSGRGRRRCGCGAAAAPARAPHGRALGGSAGAAVRLAGSLAGSRLAGEISGHSDLSSRLGHGRDVAQPRRCNSGSPAVSEGSRTAWCTGGRACPRYGECVKRSATRDLRRRAAGIPSRTGRSSRRSQASRACA